MAGACGVCGTKLGIIERIIKNRLICRSCQDKEDEARRAALEEYQAILAALPLVKTTVNELKQFGERLDELAARTGLTSDRISKSQERAFRDYALAALEDDYLTTSEERRLFDIAAVLGFDQHRFTEVAGDLQTRLFVARANDGRLSPIPVSVDLKGDELGYIETFAELLKRQAVREWQSGSAGISFRIAKGVRFSTSQTRGRMVTVGSTLVPSDSGPIVVTSRRVVFLGDERTIEVPLSKLISLDVFDDGIRIHSSGRAAPPLFRLDPGYGNAVAAAVNMLQESS
jgi:hypothetical protein